MQQNVQTVSEEQIAFESGAMDAPGDESALRTAYERLELSRFVTFEQAMSERTYATGIRNLADAISRGESPERIAVVSANDELSRWLQFTQEFRAELQAAISAREQEAVDAS